MIFKYIVPFVDVSTCLFFPKIFVQTFSFNFAPSVLKRKTDFLSHERCDITIFPFKNFPPFQPRSCISNPVQFHDREIDLARSRATFRFIVIPLLFLLCSNCVWVRIGNDSERVIDLSKGWREPRDYPFIGSIFASRWMEGTFDRGSIISPQRCQCK